MNVCTADLWHDAANRFPGLSVGCIGHLAFNRHSADHHSRHLSEIVQLPKFMGYLNPARSVTTTTSLAKVGTGYGAFNGPVTDNHPLKMISYGIISYSNLAQPKVVHSANAQNPLFLKSISIFPLPGEWERTVGFMGTCANVWRLMFAAYQGALSYCTCMLPAAGTSSKPVSPV